MYRQDPNTEEWFHSRSWRLHTLPAEDGPNCSHEQLPKLTGWMRNKEETEFVLWGLQGFPLREQTVAFAYASDSLSSQ